MNLREMTRWFAGGVHATGKPERTVNVIARALQKAGFVQVGKPGRHGGAQMADADAAALAIALLAGRAGAELIDAAEAVRAFGGRKAWAEFPIAGPDQDMAPVSRVLDLPLDHTFFDAVRAVIRIPRNEQFAAGSRVLNLTVRIEYPRQAVAAEFLVEGRDRPLVITYGRPGAPEDYLGDPWATLPGQLVEERRLNSPFFDALHHQLYAGASE